MIYSIASIIVGLPVFLFIFWKRLKEDYLSDQIFTTASFSLGGILLGFFISKLLFPNLWFWTIGIFAFLGLLLGIFKFKLRFHETFEAGFIGFMPWLSLIFLFDSVNTANILSFVNFAVIVLLLGLYYYLDTHYKNFSWYLSGRVGFAGLTTAGVFFLVRASLTLIPAPMLSLAGKFDPVISAVAAFTLFLLTYNLARKTK